MVPLLHGTAAHAVIIRAELESFGRLLVESV
jgi:hypothetical protein